MKKLIELWKAETHVFAKFLQWFLGTISTGIAALFVFWSTLPEEFKSEFSPTTLKYVAIVGAASVFLLQFTKKKTDEKA